jgi:hypothetical protein
MNSTLDGRTAESSHGRTGACPRQALALATGACDWSDRLPKNWRVMVVPPSEFTRHREYEIAAERIFGTDQDGKCCFYAHSYVLPGCRSDDDEEFYSVIVHAESVRAWRLRDDRWLIYRIVHSDEDCSASRGFYSFSEHCPQ